MIDFMLAMQSLAGVCVPVVHVSTRFPDLLSTCHVYNYSVARCRGNHEFIASNNTLSDSMRSWSCSRGIIPMCAEDTYEHDTTAVADFVVEALSAHRQAGGACRAGMAEEDDRGPIDVVDGIDGDPAAAEASAGADISPGIGIAFVKPSTPNRT